MWTPDVYEGAPTPVTAFLATAPKVAAIALFARLVHDAFGGVVEDWRQIVALLSVLSMFLGAVAAIGQRNIKRLMAYSSIAHMGYALMGLAAGTAFGVQAMLIYMAIYIVMSVGTFAFILSMEKDGEPVTDIQSLHMLAKPRRDAGDGDADAPVQPRGRAAASGLLREVLRLPRRGAGRARLARGPRRDRLGDRGVLLPQDRLLHVFRRGSRGARRGRAPVLWGFVVVSALIMVVGVVNLFGIEGWAAAAAATLVD
jgi:NADH-quinone oxidoreductase subunit N